MPVEYPVTPLGEIAHIEMGQSPDSATVRDGEGIGVPFLQGNAEFGSLYPSPRFTCLAPMKMCKAGDILISVRAPVGAINIADRDYCIGRGLAAVRIEGMTSRLAAHVISAAAPALRRVAQGTTFEAINKADLASLMVKAPTSKDRAPLSQFLDTLDTTIRQTEAIIAKLKLVKQGLLHDLLTRGIDANGELRPPQSEAPHLYKASPLGWIPLEWNVVATSSRCSLITKGTTPASTDMWQGEEGIRFLRVDNLNFDGQLSFDASNFRISKATHEGELSRSQCLPGDVLTNIVGPPLGKLGLITEESGPININQAIALFRPTSDLLPTFLLTWLGSPLAQVWLRQRAKQTSGQVNLTLALCQALPVPDMPIPEQLAIVDRVNSSQAQIDIETATLRKLEQLKSGLMDDLLTGRVRVTPLIPGGGSNG